MEIFSKASTFKTRASDSLTRPDAIQGFSCLSLSSKLAGP